ncbi:hypothetical protein Pcinc_012073 [Petrolisthes cinctipes]|uniref:Uncharacterized protein n=1 Tax=Petrolisthes cinctipes TaxID=88211 RepID=A0AAE1FZM6_PETCI|nr:hypothetical protein Pcinc_012073 [Petrolisthes cinctipes]
MEDRLKRTKAGGDGKWWWATGPGRQGLRQPHGRSHSLVLAGPVHLHDSVGSQLYPHTDVRTRLPASRNMTVAVASCTVKSVFEQ